MAKGRRDYTWGVLQDSILPGRYTSNFSLFGADQLTYQLLKNILSYTVPPGYKFFLLGVFISTHSPVINAGYVKKGTTNISVIFFEVNYFFNYGDLGVVSFEPGEVVNIECLNWDTYTYWFNTTIIGLLEELV